MATPLPQRSVFSLLLRQLDSESLLGGGVQREGLGMFPGSSRFLEGRLEGGSVARAGGLWGEALWLEPWTLGLWSGGGPHSVSGPASQLWPPRPPATALPPCSSSVRLVPGPADEWSGLAGFPASLFSNRDREAQRGARQRQTVGERPGDMQRLLHREASRGNKQGQMFQHREKQCWGGGCDGGKGAAGSIWRSLPPAVLVVLTSLIKRPLAQLNWLVNRNCL